jgi:hypothetical protein
MKTLFTEELRELDRLKKAGVVNDDEYFSLQILMICRNFLRSSNMSVADLLSMSVSDLHMKLMRNNVAALPYYASHDKSDGEP